MSAIDVLVAPVLGAEAADDPTAAPRSFGIVRRTGDSLHVASSWAEAVRASQAPHLLLIREGDSIEPGALEALSEFVAASGADLVTSDRYEGGVHRRSSRWLPLLAEQMPYAGRALLAERGLAEGVIDRLGAETTDWEALLGLAARARAVGHLPVATVRQGTRTSMPSEVERRRGAVKAWRAGRGLSPATIEVSEAGGILVRADPPDTPEVSVIIPTAFARRAIDGVDEPLADRLLRSLSSEVGAGLLGQVVLVVDENTDDALLVPARALLGDRLEVVRTSGDFNFSHAINVGLLAATCDVALLLNDDVEPLGSGWIRELYRVLARSEVVAVGARLVFEDGRLQHIGVVVPPDDLPLHPRIFEEDDAGDALSQADVPYLAVTGACLMAEREDLLEVGGLDEALPLNFNDVDLCLKLGWAGRNVVCVNSVRLIHRESSTRTARLTDEEVSVLVNWRAAAASDPHIEFWG